MMRSVRPSVLASFVICFCVLTGGDALTPTETKSYPSFDHCTSLLLGVGTAYSALVDCEENDIMFHATGGCPSQIIAYNNAVNAFEADCGLYTQS